MKDDSKDKLTKVGYDARRHYYEVFEKYMVSIAQAQTTRDNDAWLILIGGLYSITKAFIKKEEATKLKTSMEEIRSDLNKMNLRISNKEIIIRKIEKDLQLLTENIYEAAKHMLLPYHEDIAEEFDLDGVFDE